VPKSAVFRDGKKLETTVGTWPNPTRFRAETNGPDEREKGSVAGKFQASDAQIVISGAFPGEAKSAELGSQRRSGITGFGNELADKGLAVVWRK
jgi:hypothetical protein